MLDQLEQDREQKTPEDYEWLKRFYVERIWDLEEWLRRAELYESDHARFEEWMDEVEVKLMECLKKPTLH